MSPLVSNGAQLLKTRKTDNLFTMFQPRLISLGIIVIGLALAYAAFAPIGTTLPVADWPYALGLDLKGGTHLVYKADVSNVAKSEIDGAMDSLRNVIERRVNLFGVSEPVVQVERSGVLTASPEERLIVELPGVTDVAEAVRLIGKTPILEFKLLKSEVTEIPPEATDLDQYFTTTQLTGRFLSKAQLEFHQTTGEPLVAIQFNDEGRKLFAQITKANVGKVLAIFLDGAPISTPVIREEIPDGRAQISGGFNPEEAKFLVRDLNYGALPVPIELISTQTIGASLGEEALAKSIKAGIAGFILVALFLIFWYRLPGLLAVLSLSLYVAITLIIFKLIPVTLTAAGLAGFVLSIGMAVDANILIFERMKEELRDGKKLPDAIREGFARAWLSIRDSNLSSIITASILFWLGTTAVIKGFALVFGLGVLISMFTAITVSRTFLLSIGGGLDATRPFIRFLFGNGLSK